MLLHGKHCSPCLLVLPHSLLLPCVHSVTAGVVSRVDFQQYSFSGSSLLVVQIDASINSGNSGGPAFHNGKVVGIAFETLVRNATHRLCCGGACGCTFFLDASDAWLGFGLAWAGLLKQEDAENIGYIIPTEVVNHFLEDVERQTKPRIGFGRLGFQWQAVEVH